MLRTGVPLNVNARKDSEGFEIFDDYWSDSTVSEDDLSVSSVSDKENGYDFKEDTKKSTTVKKRKLSSPPRRMPSFSPAAPKSGTPIFDSSGPESENTHTLKKAAEVQVDHRSNNLADITGSIIKVNSSQESESALADVNLKRRLTFSKVLSTEDSDIEEEQHPVEDTYEESVEVAPQFSQTDRETESRERGDVIQPVTSLDTTFTLQGTESQSSAKKSKTARTTQSFLAEVDLEERDVGNGFLSIKPSPKSLHRTEDHELINSTDDSLGLVIVDEEKRVARSVRSKANSRSTQNGVKQKKWEERKNNRSTNENYDSDDSESRNKSRRPQQSEKKKIDGKRSDVKKLAVAKKQAEKDEGRIKDDSVQSEDESYEDEENAVARQQEELKRSRGFKGNAQSVLKPRREQKSTGSIMPEYMSDVDGEEETVARKQGGKSGSKESKDKKRTSRISIFSGDTSEEEEEEVVRKEITSGQKKGRQGRSSITQKRSKPNLDEQLKSQNAVSEDEDDDNEMGRQWGKKNSSKSNTRYQKQAILAKSRRKKTSYSADEEEIDNRQKESLKKKKTSKRSPMSKWTSGLKRTHLPDADGGEDEIMSDVDVNHQDKSTIRKQKQAKKRTSVIHTETTDSPGTTSKRQSYVSQTKTKPSRKRKLSKDSSYLNVSDIGNESGKTVRQRKVVKTIGSEVHSQKRKQGQKRSKTARRSAVVVDDTSEMESMYAGDEREINDTSTGIPSHADEEFNKYSEESNDNEPYGEEKSQSTQMRHSRRHIQPPNEFWKTTPGTSLHKVEPVISHKTTRTKKTLATEIQTSDIQNMTGKSGRKEQGKKYKPRNKLQEKDASVTKKNKKAGQGRFPANTSVTKVSSGKSKQKNQEHWNSKLELSDPSELYSTLMEDLDSGEENSEVTEMDVDEVEDADTNMDQVEEYSENRESDQDAEHSENTESDQVEEHSENIVLDQVEEHSVTTNSDQVEEHSVTTDSDQVEEHSVNTDSDQDEEHSENLKYRSNVTSQSSVRQTLKERTPKSQQRRKDKPKPGTQVQKTSRSNTKRTNKPRSRYDRTESDTTMNQSDMETVSAVKGKNVRKTKKQLSGTSSEQTHHQTSYISGSPAHYFQEVVDHSNASTVKKRKPRKAKIISPRIGTPGLRRSKRTRVSNLKWWENERLVYKKRESGGFAICKIQTPVETEADRKRRRGYKKAKVVKKPANLSIHEEQGDSYEEDEGHMITIIDSFTNAEVEIDCIRPESDLIFLGPSGKEATDDDSLAVSKAFTTDKFAMGYLVLRPLQEKPTQYVRSDTVAFKIDAGKIRVQIHQTKLVLQAGDFFYVPTGNSYSLKNLRKDEARLSFVQLKNTNS
ncbi:uncharacterized protein LOC144436915 [Glandiceps talaboti]